MSYKNRYMIRLHESLTIRLMWVREKVDENSAIWLIGKPLAVPLSGIAGNTLCSPSILSRQFPE